MTKKAKLNEQRKDKAFIIDSTSTSWAIFYESFVWHQKLEKNDSTCQKMVPEGLHCKPFYGRN